MWQVNWFGNAEEYEPNFNTENYNSASHSGGSRPSSIGAYSFQQHQANSDSSNAALMANPFQDYGTYNDTAFIQNQSLNAGVQFSPSNTNPPSPFTPNRLRAPTPISARAAELRAQLLKGKEERAASSTPPVSAVSNQPKFTRRAGERIVLNSSPQASSSKQVGNDHEININELISQYSEPKKDLGIAKCPLDTQGSTEASSNTSQSNMPLYGRPKDQQPPNADLSKIDNAVSNGKDSDRKLDTKATEKRPPSAHSESDGEIIESPPKQFLPPKAPKKVQPSSKPIYPDEQPKSKYGNTAYDGSASLRDQRDVSPPRRPSTNVRVSFFKDRNERRDESQPQTNRQPSQTEHVNGQNSTKKNPPALASRHGSESTLQDHDLPQHQIAPLSPRVPKSGKSVLADLLIRDDNLREWLEITGYHNAPYRDKILNRRRAIAALDAQREKLLAEMEADERGAQPQAVPGVTAFPGMLPPPLPTKVSSAIEPSLKPTSVTAPLSTPKPITSPALSAAQGNRVVSNKRPHSDVPAIRDESRTKIVRLEDRIDVNRIKEDFPRPRSGESDNSRRSPFDHHDRPDERGPYRPRYEESSSRRCSSRERSSSPVLRSYRDRGRGRSYGSTSPDYYSRERDDLSDRGSNRPSLQRGGYQGRFFDSNYLYRGRGGRGRGRGDFQNRADGRDDVRSTRLLIRPHRAPEALPFGSRGG